MRMPSNSNTVWLNGTFDVLHAGHIKLFREAKKLAGPSGKVIVGTDSDERIRELKGPTRPINNLIDRVVCDFDNWVNNTNNNFKKINPT